MRRFLALCLAALLPLAACDDASVVSPEPTVEPVSAAPAALTGTSPVRITELHYDNSGADANERVEIEAPTGTDLTGWSLLFYNGSSTVRDVYATVQLDAVPASATSCVGRDVYVVSQSGIQNGSPDGLALVDGAGTLIEFISYEGAFEAAGGPAAGTTSTDIGVEESGGTGADESLKLTDLGWTSASAETFGACNDGLGPFASAPPFARVVEFHYDNAGSDVGEAVEIEVEVGTDLTGWSIALYNGNGGGLYGQVLVPVTEVVNACDGTGLVRIETPGLQNGSPDGFALVRGDGSVVEFVSYEGSFTAADGPAAGLTSTDVGVAEESSSPVGSSIRRTEDGWEYVEANSFGQCKPVGDDPPASEFADAGVFLSELHYDNAGADEGERFEVAGPAGTSLEGWRVQFYNGNGGTPYATVDLSGEIGVCAPGGGSVFDGPAAGIQNGAPDGLALVAPDDFVVEFLSYEGVVVADGGFADGRTSTDIGVSEDGSTPIGFSLQREALEGEWAAAAENTFGCEPPASVLLSELRLDQPGGDSDEYFELAGVPGTPLDGLTLLVVGDGAGGDGVIEEVEALDGFSLDAAGAFVAAESSFSLGAADATLSLNFENGGNPTILLVRGFSGANGDDLDTDDDGVLESTPWASLADCLSLVGSALGDQPIYCDQRIGLDESFTPGHAKRDDDGWFSAIFTPGIDDTPGTIEFDVEVAPAGVIAPWGVQPPGVPTRISVSTSFLELPVGFKRALFTSVRDDFGDEVEGISLDFTPVDPAVATSDVFGNVEALGVGETELIVSAPGFGLEVDVAVEIVPDAPSGVSFQDHIEFGAPRDAHPGDDILVKRDEYVASYNPDRNASNWVAWNLEASHIGDVDRCECYTFDPLLPNGLTEVVNFDYTGSGYSRGHMTQSFNRTVTLPDNASTYWLTNILPQSAANNGGPWGDFEFYTNGRVFDGEEAYVVAGGIWSDAPSTLKDEGKVQIPDYTWKVAVFLEKDGALESVGSIDDLEVVAIITPNRIETGVPGGVDEIVSDDWTDYVVEVEEIEQRTGYDVLNLIENRIEGAIETGLDDVQRIFEAAADAGEIGRWQRFFLGIDLYGAAELLGRDLNRLAAVPLRLFVGKLELYARRGWIDSDLADELTAETEQVLETIGY